MAKTIGELIVEARQLLNDSIPISGEARFPDNELVAALNDAMFQIRQKRPDAFLGYGLRKSVPQYTLPADANTTLPIDETFFYSPLLFYVVGRSEITEDTYADNGRAVAMMNKFVNQILSVKS
jgi:hypothetical protein